MTSRKLSELGGESWRTDVTAEKPLSERAADADENLHPRDVSEVQYNAATAATAFDSGGAEVDDRVPARKSPRRWTETRGSGQTAEIASAAAAEAYARDRRTVRALALTQLAAGDRCTVDAWLDKLDGCGDPEVRSEYAEFLLRTVASGSVRVEPFCGRPPPGGPLKQLGLCVADPALMQQCFSHSSLPARPDSAMQRPIPTTRQTFYGRQPIPEDGTICYAAAFSDMS